MSEKELSEKELFRYLQKTISDQKRTIKLLTKLYDSVNVAFVEQRKGNEHSWQKVQDVIDKIDDETDLSEFR